MNGAKINYSAVLEEKIKCLQKSGKRPRLLLHCCCAPCSSYVLEYLNQVFEITAYYYNPNISPQTEYTHRANELQRLIKEMPLEDVKFTAERYDETEFQSVIMGLENEPEGGKRCVECFKLRLEKSAKYAKEHGFDCFCTTLSISPLKNSQRLNEIGKYMADKYEIDWLFSDFKKKEGYKRSIKLSEEYSLYRQNYCGCVYSKNEQKARESAKKD